LLGFELCTDLLTGTCSSTLDEQTLLELLTRIENSICTIEQTPKKSCSNENNLNEIVTRFESIVNNMNNSISVNSKTNNCETIKSQTSTATPTTNCPVKSIPSTPVPVQSTATQTSTVTSTTTTSKPTPAPAPIQSTNSSTSGSSSSSVTASSTSTSASASISTFYSLSSLQSKVPIPGVDFSNRELYLSDADFINTFQMNKQQWSALPQWKRVEKKKSVNLF
jgi:hypothetical protein